MTPVPETTRRAGALAASAAPGGIAGLLGTAPRHWAGLASLGWAAIVAAYAFGFATSASAARGTVGLDLLFFLVVLALPVALFWLVAFLADELARLRASVTEFAAAVPAFADDLAETRAVLAAEGPVSSADIARAVHVAMADEARMDLSEPLERLLRGQEDLREQLRALSADPRWTRANGRPTRPPAKHTPAPEPEPVVAEEPRPDWADLVRALNFPRDEDDKEGFRALRVALRHSGLAQTLQAAEDVLTLLSEVGIYVDDFVVEPARAEVWRQYISGTRGVAVAAAGGVADEAALDKARAMLGDPIFRDSAQHFQRRFDTVLTEFGAAADDAELAALIDTRSGRAFMLLARARGLFD